MPKPSKQSPLTLAQAEIAILTKRSAGLEGRRDQAAAALAVSSAARRRLLVDHDEPSAATLAEADRAVRDAMDAEAAARDAIREIEDRLGQLRNDVARMLEAEQRATQALQLEAAAEAVDAVTARMRQAALLLGQAQADLAAIIQEGNVAPAYMPATSDPVEHWRTFLGTASYYPDGTVLNDSLTASEVADRVAGHIVAAVLPTCSITSRKEFETPHPNTLPRALLPLPNENGVAAALANPIRAAAAAMRGTPVPA